MKDMIPSRKEKGFTLIELVMVIVILGILAAFALPRFADFSGDAKDATIRGAIGSVRSAAQIAHAAYLADGTTPATVQLDGTSIDMSTNGYPLAVPGATEAGIETAAQLSGEFSTSGTAGDTSADFIFADQDGDTASNDCGFSYNQSTGAVTILDDGDGVVCN
ncbi:MSHA pilin protein MshA [Marinobacter pelagius]|uniref:MSHA pilin protein MshA n=1 Tax=Marinobacter pelagius TaxID=379482 RepID=A0A366G3F3_9GAMM|nr:prepilin-type N-terminal cleavage/methylation domain-containing protein [Marinobacter pelagius]RBP20555.1 MSHA pilin protein MshA [Marinobacter pelagius]